MIEVFFQEYEEDTLSDYERDISEALPNIPAPDLGKKYIYAVQVTAVEVDEDA